MDSVNKVFISGGSNFNQDETRTRLRHQIQKIGCFFTNKPKNFKDFLDMLQRENKLYPEGYFDAYDKYSMNLSSYKVSEKVTDKTFYDSKKAYQDKDRATHVNLVELRKQLRDHGLGDRMKDALLDGYIPKNDINPEQRSQLKAYRLLDRTRLLMYLTIYFKTPLDQDERGLLREKNVDQVISTYKARLCSCLSELEPQRREKRIQQAREAYDKLQNSECCLENGDELKATVEHLEDRYKIEEGASLGQPSARTNPNPSRGSRDLKQAEDRQDQPSAASTHPIPLKSLGKSRSPTKGNDQQDQSFTNRRNAFPSPVSRKPDGNSSTPAVSRSAPMGNVDQQDQSSLNRRNAFPPPVSRKSDGNSSTPAVSRSAPMGNVDQQDQSSLNRRNAFPPPVSIKPDRNSSTPAVSRSGPMGNVDQQDQSSLNRRNAFPPPVSIKPDRNSSTPAVSRSAPMGNVDQQDQSSLNRRNAFPPPVSRKSDGNSSTPAVSRSDPRGGVDQQDQGSSNRLNDSTPPVPIKPDLNSLIPAGSLSNLRLEGACPKKATLPTVGGKVDENSLKSYIKDYVDVTNTYTTDLLYNNRSFQSDMCRDNQSKYQEKDKDFPSIIQKMESSNLPLGMFEWLYATRMLMTLSVYVKQPLNEKEMKLVMTKNVNAAISIYKQRLSSDLSKLEPKKRENRIDEAIASYKKLHKCELENGDDLLSILTFLKGTTVGSLNQSSAASTHPIPLKSLGKSRSPTKGNDQQDQAFPNRLNAFPPPVSRKPNRNSSTPAVSRSAPMGNVDQQDQSFTNRLNAFPPPVSRKPNRNSSTPAVSRSAPMGNVDQQDQPTVPAATDKKRLKVFKSSLNDFNIDASLRTCVNAAQTYSSNLWHNDVFDATLRHNRDVYLNEDTQFQSDIKQFESSQRDKEKVDWLNTVRELIKLPVYVKVPITHSLRVFLLNANSKNNFAIAEVVSEIVKNCEENLSKLDPKERAGRINGAIEAIRNLQKTRHSLNNGDLLADILNNIAVTGSNVDQPSVRTNPNSSRASRSQREEGGQHGDPSNHRSAPKLARLSRTTLNQSTNVNSLIPDGYIDSYIIHINDLSAGSRVNSTIFQQNQSQYQQKDNQLHGMIKKLNASAFDDKKEAAILDNTRVLITLSVYVKNPLNQQEIELVIEGRVDEAISIYKERLSSDLSKLEPKKRDELIGKAIKSYSNLQKTRHSLNNGDLLADILNNIAVTGSNVDQPSVRTNPNSSRASRSQREEGGQHGDPSNHRSAPKPARLSRTTLNQSTNEDDFKIYSSLKACLNAAEIHSQGLSQVVDKLVFRDNRSKYLQADSKIFNIIKLKGSSLTEAGIKDLDTSRMLMKLSVYFKKPLNQQEMRLIKRRKVDEAVLIYKERLSSDLSQLELKKRDKLISEAINSSQELQKSNYRLKDGDSLIDFVKNLRKITGRKFDQPSTKTDPGDFDPEGGSHHHFSDIDEDLHFNTTDRSDIGYNQLSFERSAARKRVIERVISEQPPEGGFLNRGLNIDNGYICQLINELNYKQDKGELLKEIETYKIKYADKALTYDRAKSCSQYVLDASSFNLQLNAKIQETLVNLKDVFNLDQDDRFDDGELVKAYIRHCLDCADIRPVINELYDKNKDEVIRMLLKFEILERTYRFFIARDIKLQVIFGLLRIIKDSFLALECI